MRVGVCYWLSYYYSPNNDTTHNVFALNGEELIGDAVLIELERIYNKKVYNKDDVPGKIRYLTKEKGWWI